MISQQMGHCYVLFHGKQPRIYHTWHECSEQVLRFKNAIYKKHSTYEQAVIDFNASVGALIAPLVSTKDARQSTEGYTTMVDLS
jgi:viroplasmin and RNaseH domain-containing protein